MVPIVIPVEELKEQFIGRYFLVKKQFRYDERSPEILKNTSGSLVLEHHLGIEEHLSRRADRIHLD